MWLVMKKILKVDTKISTFNFDGFGNSTNILYQGRI